MTTRIFNALLGVWLFFSAFMWQHAPAEKAVTILAAVLTFILAIASIYVGVARFLNAGLAVLLFLCALALPALTHATTWNNTIVAASIFVAALVDNGPQSIRRERELYGRI
ncbi:MAG TPA: hypothetical protein VHG72_01595 [Polyangia bacterium]|nr:hypothetical protein [Polyangia bacterium]